MKKSYLKVLDDNIWCSLNNDKETSTQAIVDFINTLIAGSKYIDNITFAENPTQNFDYLKIGNLLRQYNKLDGFEDREQISKLNIEISDLIHQISIENPNLFSRINHFISVGMISQKMLKDIITYNQAEVAKPVFCDMKLYVSNLDEVQKQKLALLFGNEYEKVISRMQLLIEQFTFVYKDLTPDVEKILNENKIPSSLLFDVMSVDNVEKETDVGGGLDVTNEELDTNSKISLLEAAELIKQIKPDFLTEEQLMYLNSLSNSLQKESSI